MKTLAAIAGAVMMLAGVGFAHGGVVVDEQQTVDQPGGGTVTRTRIVMIEGNKQKSIIDSGNRTVITDLDRGIMTMMDSGRRSYVELPFPPQGPMAQMQAGMPKMSFKKTGERNKVIGYSCEVYVGSGTVGPNAVSVTGCFSSSAPGASEYTAFQRTMADKVKGTSMENMGQIPDGVPLKLKVTTKTGQIPTSGMSADQAAKVNKMLSNRQFVTDTVVSKISKEKLAGDSFDVPSGYEKQALPPMFGGPGKAPAPGGGGASQKVPE
ncbi:MAG TPA: hypothetical protein VJN94_08040 [Candidatus Binataceae bacterium]|nr:hypothetical protein [Candidatus Binataceae bacterium]